MDLAANRLGRGGRTLLCAAILLACPGPALAVGFHYASSSNRIYVEFGGSATLSDIKAALPSAPLDEIGPGVWHLRANIQIIDGSTLVLHGTGIGGDVDELRLKSDDGAGAHVQITADHGNIDIEGTKITSWNADTGAPDTEHATGRAFIRVRAELAADGVTPLESRMDVIDSEISHLGFNDAESYGLVWKVNGFTGANPELFDQVQVRGNIIGSHIHHNYYGVYTFGHQDGLWRDNEVDHNVGYGFDPHDDTDNLLIENNFVHDNGNHGIIASKRCDHVVIRNNRSNNNVGNGIMLHRSSNDGLVEGNEANDNTDSGIAIFATARTLIRNNTLLRNGRAGIRMSMGTTDSRVENNEIGFSGRYGFYFYRGSDTPEPGSDGRNKRNVLKRNNVHDIAAEAIKVTDSDATTFYKNTFAAVGSRFRFDRSAGTLLNGNTYPTSSVVTTLSGTAELPSSVTVKAQFVVRLELRDDHSTAQFRDSRRAAFDPDEALYTSISSTSSLLTLTRALIGSTTTVLRRHLFAAPTPGMKVRVQPTVWTSTSRAWLARATTSAGSVQYAIAGLAPGAQYEARQGSSVIGTFTADAGGQISFTVTPGTTATLGYTVDRL